jgi:hypothetical protein
MVQFRGSKGSPSPAQTGASYGVRELAPAVCRACLPARAPRIPWLRQGLIWRVWLVKAAHPPSRGEDFSRTLPSHGVGCGHPAYPDSGMEPCGLPRVRVLATVE